MMSSSSSLPFLFLSLFLLFSPLAFAHSPSCRHDHHNHHEGRGDHIHHRHDHGHHHHDEIRISKLAEEIAEEEDLELHGFDHHYNQDLELSTLGLWVNAMGCSLLVSLASLICLIILPVICLKGKPSKAVVDCLAVFGAGAMLGDAFLHQLPHAFGGGHSHSHEHHFSNIDDPHHGHGHEHEHGHSHAHSLQDLSLGLSVLFGIILFLLVEKIVRYVEENAEIGVGAHGHHHHHHHERQQKLKEDDENNDVNKSGSSSKIKKADLAVEEKLSDADSDGNVNDDSERKTLLRKRTTSSGSTDSAERDSDAINGARNDPTIDKASSNETFSSHSSSSLIFGYLNLFSDGVHNFTDGMTLGSAFLLHGSVGGWSRTLFLLAHELPQEIGDFGILVRSGFTVSKALFYNFLSALVALAGTALALILGKDPGHSALIEGFTAGGFIYIAVAGVLPGMNNGKTTVRGTAAQLISLISGMTVALCISLVE